MTAAIAVLLAITTAGCGAGAAGGSNQPGVQGPASAAPGPAGAAQRVSIEGSSEQDLSAVLRTNGISDPARWAKIITANRPYPASAAGQQKLQQVLTQFQADPDTMAKVTNALTP